jgi:hypothetical protein
VRGIDMICLLQQAHPFGKVAHRARIENGHAQTVGPQKCKRLPLISARGLHGHQLHMMLFGKRQPTQNSVSTVGEAAGRPLGADPSLRRRNTYSTNDLGHGNLPCTCDWQCDDCSVVSCQRRQSQSSRAVVCRRDNGCRPTFSTTNVAVIQIQGTAKPKAWGARHPSQGEKWRDRSLSTQRNFSATDRPLAPIIDASQHRFS